MEIEQPKQEIKYTITGDALMHALANGGLPDIPWIKIVSGKELARLEYSRIFHLDSLLLDKKYILLKNVKVEHHLSFNKSTFQGKHFGMIALDCVLPEVNISEYNADIWFFSNSAISIINISAIQTGEFVFNGNCLCSIFKIHYSFLKSIQIYKSSFFEISIFNSICDSIYLLSRSDIAEFSVSQSAITKILISDKSKIEDVSITKHTTINLFEIWDIIECNSVSIDDSHCSDIEIRLSEISQIFIHSSSASLLLNNTTTPKLRIGDCNIDKLSWQGSIKGETYILNSSLNFLSLSENILLKDSIISIHNSKINIAILDQLTIQGQLIFREISALKNRRNATDNYRTNYITSTNIIHLKPEIIEVIKDGKQALWQKITESELRVVKEIKSIYTTTPLLNITNSSLNNTEIVGSDLKDFHFKYRDSKLFNMFISGTSLPNDNFMIYDFTLENSKDINEQKIFYYNQLKKIFENQGNIVEATKYHSKSMEYQEKLLIIHYNENKGRKHKYDVNNWFEIRAFQLNRYSNNHGENWLRALVFVLSGSFLMYCFYFTFQFYDQDFDPKRISHFFADYLSFLDPTHKIDFLIEKDKVKPMAKLFDFLGRIFIAYGLYQFISAFRKHGRKSGV